MKLRGISDCDLGTESSFKNWQVNVTKYTAIVRSPIEVVVHYTRKSEKMGQSGKWLYEISVWFYDPYLIMGR